MRDGHHTPSGIAGYKMSRPLLERVACVPHCEERPADCQLISASDAATLVRRMMERSLEALRRYPRREEVCSLSRSARGSPAMEALCDALHSFSLRFSSSRVPVSRTGSPVLDPTKRSAFLLRSLPNVTTRHDN